MDAPKRTERKTVRWRPWELEVVQSAARGRVTFSEFVRDAALERAREQMDDNDGRSDGGR